VELLPNLLQRIGRKTKHPGGGTSILLIREGRKEKGRERTWNVDGIYWKMATRFAVVLKGSNSLIPT
jgi:hypothetical protein